MNQFDLLIKNGMVYTAVDSFEADIAVKDGKIIALGQNLGNAERVIDAEGMLVLPGGIDAHCHIEQESSTRIMTADDFYSGSVSAAFGGNTTFLPFAAQHRGQSLREVVDTARDRARTKAVIDYGLHLIISDPTEKVLEEELPPAVLGQPGFGDVEVPVLLFLLLICFLFCLFILYYLFMKPQSFANVDLAI